MAKIPASETAESFQRVANDLRDMASELEKIAALFETYRLAVVDIPVKTTALNAITGLRKWVNQAQLSLNEAKQVSGYYGPDTRGTGPMAGKEIGPRGDKQQEEDE